MKQELYEIFDFRFDILYFCKFICKFFGIFTLFSIKITISVDSLRCSFVKIVGETLNGSTYGDDKRWVNHKILYIKLGLNNMETKLD